MIYSCQDFPQQQLDTDRCLPTFTCEDCVRLHLHRASARVHRLFTLCSASLAIAPLRVAMLLRALSGSCTFLFRALRSGGLMVGRPVTGA